MLSPLRLAIESIFVSFIILCIGFPISHIIDKIKVKHKYNLPSKLLLTGAVSHVILEMSGINQWYCVNRAIKL